MSDAYFFHLMRSLAERSGEAAISQLGFANIPIRHRLRELFEEPYGATGAFLADPAFEAAFGWKTADRLIGDLEEGLLTRELVNAMDQAGDYAFKRQMFPYQHQMRSWELLSGQDPQSLVVTSGTGSGKTECFMVPILDHLARQRREHGPLVGVRALFLYPLNALINNQRNRLRAWTEPFGGDIRFCLYNGNTPERPERAARQKGAPSEVLDRQSLRSLPPPILVTNSTMLEYMLVRTQDAPILEQSQGKLEWVVLDEAHTYIGSQAAEVSLLLRRVIHAFGVAPEQVRFIATSATIGDPEGPAGAELRRFLADVAGVDIERVHLIAGERDIPSLSDPNQDSSLALQELEQIDAGSVASLERYAALSAHPVARAIRRLFTEAGQGGSVARLSQVCQSLFGTSISITKDRQLEGLRWLDLLSGTRSQPDGESFLPLRAHFFHQTLSGIWACSDKNCAEKQGALSEDAAAWPFGAIYLEPRKHCTCGSPAYEIVSCSDCGEVYLVAGESEGHLLHLNPPHLLDDFELEADDAMEEEELEEPITSGHQNKVLIANREGANVGALSIDRETRKITELSEVTLELVAQEDDGSGLSCPQCSAQETSRNHLFRHGRLSAPFLLGNILPTLLEYAPDGNKPQDHPYRGRRLLSFTDSRQGTARLAAKLQQEAERNRVRGLVYHLSLQSSGGGDPQQKQKLKQALDDLRKAFEQTPIDALANIIKEKELELAQLDKPQPVTFNDLGTSLAAQARDIQFMRQTYRHNAPDLFANDLGDVTLARMFLVREFGRRPKRANSLETMGLVATYYPALDKIIEVPREVTTHAGFDLKTWRDFLKICLDFFVRSGGSLNFPREWKNWLGMRFGQTWLVPHSQKEVARGQRRWPSVRRGRSSSVLVRLLAYVLDVDSESPLGADRIDSVLRNAWDTLCIKGLLRQDELGWRLPMDQMAFLPMQQAFDCPVTRRLLDTTLKGVTPYLPRNATKSTAVCAAFQIPTYPTPFGGVTDELERIRLARDWLGKNKQIDQLRDQGLWSDLNDRVIELAPFFRTAEHSAQQDARRLQGYEEAFQAGDINLLSCSTTMEMGIDIGGVSLVSMNNVPPHPASYLQRAGRAGRRRESRSLAMTLCKSNPHDQIVFSNTRWAFDTSLAPPKVSLDSPVIVQRHVHAMLLTAFFRKQLAKTDQDQLKLNCGAFFLGEPQSLAVNFSIWCRGMRTRQPQALEKGLKQLLRRTLYERLALDGLLEKAASEMDDLASAWRTEWDNLKTEQEQIKREAGESSPAYRAVGYHMKRLGEEYLLRELANRGFLPAYGFPSHITPFDNYTVDRFKRDKRAQDTGREDNRSRFREMPSRELATALREYAPGSQVVMDGLVYRSAGLTLNWHVPADQEDVKEVQNIKFAWRCHQCGDSGTTHSLPDAGICPSCGTGIKEANRRQFIEPAGFAVDFYETPSNDVDSQQFIPVEAPWIAPEGEWISLPNPDLGRFRTTTKGHIYHQSRGIHGTGYALCLECGRAEPMSRDGDMPEQFAKQHRKLRRSKDDAPYCPGSDDSWKVKEGITLGHETWTDACEFQLKTSEGLWLSNQVAATTLAVAMRDALAELIGVESTELACATKQVRTEDGGVCQSIILFDRYAAGYASSVPRYLSELFLKARKKLLCPNDCDSVCPHCVLDFDQRFAAEQMNRHRALEMLTEQWVNGFQVPDRYAYFGERTRPVFRPLIDSIWQAVSSGHFSELRLYAGGELDSWDIALSPLRKLAYQIASSGPTVSLVIPATVSDRLDEAERHLLASLADAPNITLYAYQTAPRCGDGWLLAEAIGAETERWAGENPSALRFNMDWGQVEHLLLATTVPDAPLLDATPLNSDSLRPAVELAGDRELEIGKELNGRLKTFGKRFWDYLAREHDPTLALLNSSDPITVVRYQDRYLFSPLSVRLLLDLVRALRDWVGEERWSKPVMQIETLASKSYSSRRGQSPRFLWDDWEDQATRIEVIETLFGGIGAELHGQFNDDRRQAHARLLEVCFASGQKLRLRLDQGISYWRVSRSADYRSRTFSFAEADAKQQALALLRADVPMEGDEHATQIFIRKLEM